MTIDKSKLQICVVCNQTIQPTYLGKALDNPKMFIGTRVTMLYL